MPYEFDRSYIEEVIMLSALALFLVLAGDTRLSNPQRLMVFRNGHHH
jgi:hypothetical protein